MLMDQFRFMDNFRIIRDKSCSNELCSIRINIALLRNIQYRCFSIALYSVRINYILLRCIVWDQLSQKLDPLGKNVRGTFFEWAKIFLLYSLHRSICVWFLNFYNNNYALSKEHKKRLGFPFLKIRNFNFQTFWNNSSKKVGSNIRVFWSLAN